MRRLSIFILFFLFLAVPAHAEVSIETSLSRSRLAVGEELQLDVIISNADGLILKPNLASTQGFTAYSQAHSQEISIINGRSTSKSIFSYVLIPNSEGRKQIGPFEITIGGKIFKVAPVEVEVLPAGSSSGASGWSQSSFSQAPVSAPPARALPGASVGDQDIFVKAWLDKDEAYVNEPVMLTYTLYTRLSATYKGFEKEPVTTGFWVEDFPPEKTVKRTEQFLGGSRYVVADVRKMALFPTQAGVFTLDPGLLAAAVEIREQDNFDSFFSYNIFGRRSQFFSSPFSQIVQKKLPTDKPTLTVRALPEAGKPANFTGAVGQYAIESSIDKNEVEEGTPVTFRVRITGRGNLNIVQPPAFPRMELFKTYDSSTSTNISKDRLVVEGEKITETVIVPRNRGTYTVPSLSFSYFDPVSSAYREIKTPSHVLTVIPAPEGRGETAASAERLGIEPVDKEDVEIFGKDIRYIETIDTPKAVPQAPWHRSPVYWLLNVFLLMGGIWFVSLARKQEREAVDFARFRIRRSHAVARGRLKTAARMLREGKTDAFYAELSKALYGYFGDKLGVSNQMMDLPTIESRLSDPQEEATLLSEIRSLFEALSFGRFSAMSHMKHEMTDLYKRSERVIASFEKVKLK